MAAVIKKGPWRLGASFAVGWVVFRFLASNHTRSPTQKGVNLEGMDKFCALRSASVASFRVVLIVSNRWFKGGDVVSRLVWWTRGMYPMILSKGAFPVVALGQALSVY